MPNEPTIREFLSGILPRLRDDDRFPWWPPDCFAICMALLKQTGVYLKTLHEWPPDRSGEDAVARWAAKVRELGRAWRTTPLLKGFDGLKTEWEVLCNSWDRLLWTVEKNRPLCEALITLIAVADEASEGAGSPPDPDEDDEFLRTSRRFAAFGSLRVETDEVRLRVLPRMHTPQNGLTDRSLSLYLSLCDAGEVTPRWLSTSFIRGESLNLLMIPWPFEVLASQFRDVTDRAEAVLPDTQGFFTYEFPDTDKEAVEVAESLYTNAKRKLGRIDGVVFPELAITEHQFQRIREKLPSDCFLIAGVGSSATSSRRGQNEVRLSFPPLDAVRQRKHHPWKLERNQVTQYGLGGVLTPFRGWWECADFTDRQLNFIQIGHDLVVTALICEHLARPDPVANLVRAVGPNLVVALLMDGPQTKERWAARYATVLADDPGCSVLALTSIGMAELSRPKAGPSRSRVIALWKDAFEGPTEIELPAGYAGVAISLSIRYEEEYTADGRGADSDGAYPVLSGIHPIAATNGQKR
jgi:predicted amidohydrolase